MAKAKKVSTKKEARFYPTEKTHKRLHRNAKPKVGKTRDSITEGTVLVLLSGRFRGKRVVYLKTLPSGLLLVTGPFKVNGVPLRRVNQAYVAATQTKIDISKVFFLFFSLCLFSNFFQIFRFVSLCFVMFRNPSICGGCDCVLLRGFWEGVNFPESFLLLKL